MPPRHYDPITVGSALLAQTQAVRRAASQLSGEQLAGPSGLPGWDVHHLLVHMAQQLEAVPRFLDQPAPAGNKAQVDLTTWALSTASVADRLDELTQEAALATPDANARIDDAVRQLNEVLPQARSTRLIPHVFGPMRAVDFLVTRLVELVVHSDDLAVATGVEVDFDREALAAVTRLLADALVGKAPGGSVELRVPPFVAVQCVAGAKHTRGTPPHVIETDARTWLRLATGRLTWAEATEGILLNVKGERADLSTVLPILG